MGDFIEDEEWTKSIKKSKRKDKRKQIQETLSRDLNDREQWMGIKKLRKQYQPIPFSRRTKEGKHKPMAERAEEAAKCLAREVWCRQRGDQQAHEEGNGRRSDKQGYPKLVNGSLGIDCNEIRMGELNF